MKNKLKFKRKRVLWYDDFIKGQNLYNGFLKWKHDNDFNIRSLNKLAYLYLVHLYGRSWCSFVRDMMQKYPETANIRLVVDNIIRFDWIKRDEL